MRSISGLTMHRVAPPPAPGGGVIRFGAARHLCEGEAFRRAELCRYFDLADISLRQHTRRPLRNRRARQRDVRKFFVLKRQLRALDLLVRARALQALGEMAPVRRFKRAFAIMRAGGGDMRAQCDQLFTQREDPRIAGRRAGFDDKQRILGLFPHQFSERASFAIADFADHVARHDEIGGTHFGSAARASPCS